MAQISITIPDAHLARVQDAFGAHFEYTGVAPDGTAESKAQHVRRRLREYALNVVRTVEVRAAAEEAAKASAAAVKADFG